MIKVHVIRELRYGLYWRGDGWCNIEHAKQYANPHYAQADLMGIPKKGKFFEIIDIWVEDNNQDID